MTNFYNKSEINSSLSSKEPLLSTSGDKTINVGRGDVYFENHIADNTDGAGITMRVSSNPVNGAMFSVRSSSNKCRLWVGQTITTTGENEFYIRYTGSPWGSEYDSTQYRH